MDDVRIAHHETADGGKRFGAGADHQVHFAVFKAKVFAGAAARFTQNTRRVRVVHNNARAVFFADFNDFRQRANISFHTEYAVYDNQFSGFFGQFGNNAFQIRHIVVFKAHHFAVGKFNAVQNAGVVQLVHNGVIAFFQKAAHHAQVHLIPGGKNKPRFFAFKFGDALFQFVKCLGVAV